VTTLGRDQDYPPIGDLLERNQALMRARRLRISSLLGAVKEPSALVYDGGHVFKEIARSVHELLTRADLAAFV
jgi:hypothetical protein